MKTFPSRATPASSSAWLPRSRTKLLALAVASCFTSGSYALPTDPTVTNGAATFAKNGNVLNVTNSNGAIIDWKSFSIGVSETTRFIQTSASSAVLNRVLSNDPSLIYGTLTSNGRVFLVNPAGIMVGAGGRVDVAGFVASTLNISKQNFLDNRQQFDATAGAGSVINQGSITTPSGGSVYLIGPNVTNEGIITTPKGETILAAGQTVSLIDTATPGVKVDITGAEGNVTNLGSVIAEAGRIGMAGVLVKNSGILNASSVVSEGGRIFLKASRDAVVDGSGRIVVTGIKGGSVEVLGDRVAVMDNASIDASATSEGGDGGSIKVGGDYQGKNPDIQNASITYFGPNARLKADAGKVGDGGTVIVWADDTTSAYGSISARGGNQGGNGGFVETSGHNILNFSARVDTRAPRGRVGTLLLDPSGVCLYDTLNSGCAGFGSQLQWSLLNLTTTDVTVNTSTSGDDIKIAEGYIWSSGYGLELFAHHDIDTSGQTLHNSGGGSFVLVAGWNGLFGLSAATTGVGDVTGGGHLNTSTSTSGVTAGNITVTGNSITLGNLTGNGADGVWSGIQNGGNGATITLTGTSISVASITASGGNASSSGVGGNGGTITVAGTSINLGNITANGGGGGDDGSSLRGGNGGLITIHGPGASGAGATSITVGDITANGGFGGGGDGAEGGAGGAGGEIRIKASLGTITVGNVSANGGAGGGNLAYGGGFSPIGGDGGSGGIINLHARDAIQVNGALSANGGTGGDGAEGARGGNGRIGGQITLLSDTAGITITGDVSAKGGNGGHGGNHGTSFSASNGPGGSGGTGGEGGTVNITATAGSISVGGNIVAYGGNGGSGGNGGDGPEGGIGDVGGGGGVGGEGGNVTLKAGTTIVITEMIGAYGGSGGNGGNGGQGGGSSGSGGNGGDGGSGGRGGSVELQAAEMNAFVASAIYANGGTGGVGGQGGYASSGMPGKGGDGGDGDEGGTISLTADSVVVVGLPGLYAYGGDGGEGGNGNSGSYYSNGGHGGNGRKGGIITVTASAGIALTGNSTIDVKGGAGGNGGSAGTSGTGGVGGNGGNGGSGGGVLVSAIGNISLAGGTLTIDAYGGRGGDGGNGGSSNSGTQGGGGGAGGVGGEANVQATANITLTSGALNINVKGGGGGSGRSAYNGGDGGNGGSGGVARILALGNIAIDGASVNIDAHGGTGGVGGNGATSGGVGGNGGNGGSGGAVAIRSVVSGNVSLTGGSLSITTEGGSYGSAGSGSVYGISGAGGVAGSTIISAGGDIDVSMALDGSQVVGSLDLSAGGTLTLNNNISIVGSLGLTGGSIIASSPVTATASLNALVIAGTLNLSGGAMIDAGGNLGVTAGAVNLTGGSKLRAGNEIVIEANSLNLNLSQIEATASAVTIAVAESITLDNGSYIKAGTDVNLTLNGADSLLTLNSVSGQTPSYIWALSPNTISLSFPLLATGGVVIDGSQTLQTIAGGSGLYVGPGFTPAAPGSGLNTAYQAKGDTGNTVTNDLLRAISSINSEDSEQDTGLKRDDEKRERDKEKFGDEDEKDSKPTKPGQKRVSTCGV